MFGLCWHPMGPDWTDAHVRAARQLFFDVCELDGESVFPLDEDDLPSTSGDPTAASGALAGSGGEEATEVRAEGPCTYVSCGLGGEPFRQRFPVFG